MKSKNKLQAIMPKLYDDAMREPVKQQCAVCGDWKKALLSGKIYLCSKKCKGSFERKLKSFRMSPEVEELVRNLSRNDPKAYEFIKWGMSKESKK